MDELVECYDCGRLYFADQLTDIATGFIDPETGYKDSVLVCPKCAKEITRVTMTRRLLEVSKVSYVVLLS